MIATDTSRDPLWVAGIGASAGGLEATLQLCGCLPRQGRLACVLAQHQANDGHTELLARQLARTSLFEVSIAVSGDRLRADQLLVIPAGNDGRVEGGRLMLHPPASDSLSTPSVNVLLTSLAVEYGPRSMGIILSGAGSDGVAGCRAIQGRGGLTLAQTPASSRFDGMPGAAVAAGVIQHALELPRLARQVADIVAPPASISAVATPGAVPAALGEVLQSILRVTGTDFRGYKPETLLRRIQTRMTAVASPSLEHYSRHLAERPAEARALQSHFLVSLSSFLRDRESFRVLQGYLKEALAGRPPDQPFRIWTPACATGEETYSLALLVCEILGSLPGTLAEGRAWLSGTDLNEEALAAARQGIYPAKALQEVEAELVERYFERTGLQYRVSETIRRMCRFSCQDLLSGEAPPELDLISCRNLLIYLDSEAQATLIRKLHGALVPHGLLFIGPAETLGPPGHALFRPLDPQHRIYRRKANPQGAPR